MFIVDENPTFTHAVTVKKPVDGGFRDETLKATYRVLPPEELDQFDLSSTEGSTDFLRRVIASLDDIAGPDKTPIPYCDELRDKVIALTYARAALSRGYFQAISGAKSGN